MRFKVDSLCLLKTPVNNPLSRSMSTWDQLRLVVVVVVVDVVDSKQSLIIKVTVYIIITQYSRDGGRPLFC